MKPKSLIAVNITFLFMTFLALNLGYAQNNGERTFRFPGVIEQVSTDFGFIVVNETKISLSLHTQVMNERGDSLSPPDLKPGRAIILEVLTKPSGFLAKKIIVKAGK
jgi:hypothetical protein